LVLSAPSRAGASLQPAICRSAVAQRSHRALSTHSLQGELRGFYPTQSAPLTECPSRTEKQKSQKKCS